MSDGTKIQWTDATWNPITGCTRVSRGCEHCYAERLAAGRLRHHTSRAGLTDEHGRWNGTVRFNKEWIDQPLKWKKPRRVFVVAHGDLFHESVPDAWIDRVFAVMAMSRQHVFQVLTKRPKRMRQYLSEKVGKHPGNTVIERLEKLIDSRWQGKLLTWPWAHKEDERWPLKNVWIGTSVEDQQTAGERILHLRETPAAVRWLSVEPLLGSVDLRVLPAPSKPYSSSGSVVDLDPIRWERRSEVLCQRRYDALRGIIGWEGQACLPEETPDEVGLPKLDWVVCGGESGPGYRPMKAEWARTIRDQCKHAGVPFFMKQMAGKVDIPSDLMIREYPT